MKQLRLSAGQLTTNINKELRRLRKRNASEKDVEIVLPTQFLDRHSVRQRHERRRRRRRWDGRGGGGGGGGGGGSGGGGRKRRWQRSRYCWALRTADGDDFG